MNQALRNFCTATTAAILIAACGGGSGGDGGLTGGTGASEPATITADNAAVVAGVAAETALGQGGLTSDFSPGIPFGSYGADAAVAPVLKPALAAAMKTAGPSRLFVTSAGRENCTVSGTVDIEVSISDPTAAAVDDRYAFEFADCDDGVGTVLNGGMTITIVAIDGDVSSGNFLVGMQIEFSAFAVTEAGETASANGTVSIEIDTSEPPVTVIVVSSSAFVTTTNGTEEILTDFTSEITEDGSTFPVAVTVETSFTISSPRIGGDVTVRTSLVLESMGTDFPFAGELRITGADNAVIVMIALDANTVRLEIDVDGDGATDETLQMTWDELMAAAT